MPHIPEPDVPEPVGIRHLGKELSIDQTRLDLDVGLDVTGHFGVGNPGIGSALTIGYLLGGQEVVLNSQSGYKSDFQKEEMKCPIG